MLDREQHGPRSQILVNRIIGTDKAKQDEAMAAVVAAMEARKRYLDDTLEVIESV